MKKKETKKNSETSINKKLIIAAIPVVLIFLLACFVSVLFLVGVAGFSFYKNAEVETINRDDLPAGFPQEFEFYPDSELLNSFFSKRDKSRIYTINLIAKKEDGISDQEIIKYYSEFFQENGWIIIEQNDYGNGFIEAQKSHLKATVSASGSGNSKTSYSVILIVIE